MIGAVDIAIVLLYLAVIVGAGFWISKRSSGSLGNYFLAGNTLPWYVLGLSNASGMFDVAGTMWMVGLFAVYGVKSIYFPWLWPVFNQVFLMMFLAIWLRRSGAMTGAEWITLRFGDGPGARAAHMINVLFALLTVVGMIAFGFLGIGKLAAEFSPLVLSPDPLLNEKIYGLIIVGLTTLYSVKGGMYSVVVTEVLQFFIKLVVCIAVAVIAMTLVTPAALQALTPAGWASLSIPVRLDLDWLGVARTAPAGLAVVGLSAAQMIGREGHGAFAAFVGLMLFQGVFKSLAGPAPNYDMQRLLSARTPTEAAKISAFVNVVLLFPRYLMITGLAVLAIVFIGPEWTRLKADALAHGRTFTGDFDTVLPFALRRFMPVGLLGLALAGMLSAFMASYSASLNAAPAYVVNDIYRKYINKNASQSRYVRLSYAVSLLFAVVGAVVGWRLTSINDIVAWITTGLYGGYTAANFIKWFWWRLNGVGYSLSMAVGVGLALYMPAFHINELQAFPLVFAVCLAVAIAGSLLTAPTDPATLAAFYVRTRPWGLWAPVRAAMARAGQVVEPNRDMGRDLFNVAVGMIWQTALTATAIFLVIKAWPAFALSTAVVALTSTILWRTWWRRLPKEE